MSDHASHSGPKVQWCCGSGGSMELTFGCGAGCLWWCMYSVVGVAAASDVVAALGTGRGRGSSAPCWWLGAWSVWWKWDANADRRKVDASRYCCR